MSYRQCRNFIEMLRSLGYPRLVSMENFKKPNFELVADILYWLAQRYDPHTEISDNINAEKDRVEFIRSIATLFSTKARIKLTPRKLYQADSNAVQEMLKITTVLYKAYNTSGVEEEEAGSFNLPTKISNLKAHKILANEICELGAKLNDSLSKEPELRQSRQDALNFLDSMGRSSDTANDQAYIEQCVKQIIKQQDESVNELMKYVSNMQKEEKNLQEKIKKKGAQLQRAEKRYKSLVNAKPAYMDEYERLEAELERLYQVYVEKYRNLDYLEHQLDEYNRIEEEKLQNTKKRLEDIQDAIRKADILQIKGEEDLNRAIMNAGGIENESDRGVSRGNSRSKPTRNDEGNNRNVQQQRESGRQIPKGQPIESQQDEESQEDELEDDDEEEGEGESDGDF